MAFIWLGFFDFSDLIVELNVVLRSVQEVLLVFSRKSKDISLMRLMLSLDTDLVALRGIGLMLLAWLLCII